MSMASEGVLVGTLMSRMKPTQTPVKDTVSHSGVLQTDVLRQGRPHVIRACRVKVDGRFVYGMFVGVMSVTRMSLLV